MSNSEQIIFNSFLLYTLSITNPSAISPISLSKPALKRTLSFNLILLAVVCDKPFIVISNVAGLSSSSL